MPENFEHDFLGELGFSAEDPTVAAALEDGETHLRLVETLVGIREGRKLKQGLVADRMGTTQSRVSNFERLGGDPRLSTILRYARAVDAKVRMSVSATPRGWTSAGTKHTSAVIEAASVDDFHLERDWQAVPIRPAVCG